MNQNLDLKNFKGNIFLNHHNLIKNKFCLLSNEPINADASTQKINNSPLFITNFNFQAYRPSFKNKSFSSLSLNQNENQKKSYNTLNSFHHQINFQKYKNRKKNNFFSQTITENKIISKPLSENKCLKSPKNKKVKEIFSKIDTKIKKRASLNDVMDILQKRKTINKNILKEFLDPKVDLQKFYIKKADEKSIELSQGGKKRTKISIIPIKNLGKTEAPPQISTERNALQNFFQKSLKGNYHTSEKEHLNNIHEEIWGDVEEIKKKLYEKLEEKPQKEEESAYFRFSEKTIAGIGKEKFEKMKINFNRRKNPINLDNYQSIGDPKLTYEDLNFVKEQYLSSSTWKDYKLLEMLTRNLKCFHTISKDSRMIILKNAEFLEVPCNEIIQGSEECEAIFIILKGGVNLKGSFQKNQVNNILILSSYFDGDYFGDYSKETSWNFSNQPKKGILTIKNPFFQAFEQTFMLKILFKIWDGLLNKLIKRDLDEKLRILKNNGLFMEEQQRTLFPLASQMEMKFYKLGEVIINVEDLIDCFYIIANGRCALLYKESVDEEQKKRVFPSEYKNDCIGTLHENDYFGTRAIFSDDELRKKSQKFGETINKYSNLTVVADRDETLLLKLEQKAFYMLPLELQNKLRLIFFDVMEFDMIDVDKLQREMKNWADTKKNIKRLVMEKKN